MPALVRLVAVEAAAGNPLSLRVEYPFLGELDADHRRARSAPLKVMVIPWPANQKSSPAWIEGRRGWRWLAGPSASTDR